MKRFKCIAIVLAVLIMLFSCCGCENLQEANERLTGSMFTVVEKEVSWMVVYHKDTKVMYVVSFGGGNSGNFTMLVDDKGKPLIYKDKRSEQK